MGKKKSELDWLNRELMISPYCYSLCLDEAAFEKELKRLKIPKRMRPAFLSNSHCNATVDFFEKRGGIDLCCIVRMRPPKDRIREEIYGVLVHEAVHIWQACREYIGEKFPASEQEAYSIQRIAMSLMVSYRDQMLAREDKKGGKK